MAVLPIATVAFGICALVEIEEDDDGEATDMDIIEEWSSPSELVLAREPTEQAVVEDPLIPEQVSTNIVAYWSF